jgi:RNA polymerase sigma-70 factor (ECF subfamily)
MSLPDSATVAWVSANVIPFEAELRAKLRRRCESASEVDDLIQDVYYRILKMDSVEHVRDAKAFLMQTAKNILIDRVRRDAVVYIDSVANLDDLDVADAAPSPERVALARAELKWVLGLVSNLPDRCKQVFRARKIYGMSQDETATSLGITENVVEKEMMRGLKLVSQMVAQVAVDGGAMPEQPVSGVRTLRKRNV